jgi:uncharacterized protein (DUF2147 family)
MKKLLAMAALLLASTAAQAQYTFEYGGHTIRIDPDRGTVQIPGVYDNTGQGKAKKAKSDAKAAPKADSKADQARIDAQQPASPPAAAPPAAESAVAPSAASPAPPPAPPAAPATTTATTAPADNALAPPPAPPPAATQQTTPAVQVPPAVAAAPPVPPAPPPPAAPPVQTATAAPAAAPTRDLNSPLGVWLTEEKEGKVRIEQCGSNLCGYSVDAKSNQNGEQILINMKPGKDQKWSGRILDPNSGSTYDSTIAMRGTDRLRVQGCAFGGMFCGGQTWTRVN